MSFLVALFAQWGVPEGLRKVLGYLVMMVAVVALFTVAKTVYDNIVIARHDAKVEIQAQKAAARAVQEAQSAVDQSKSQVEKSNDEVRKAAGGANDPLKSGLDRLRTVQGGDHPASGESR